MLNYQDYIPELLKKTYQDDGFTPVKRRKHAVRDWAIKGYRRWQMRRVNRQQAPQREMFIAVYEFTLKAHRHSEFRQAWRQVTEGIYLQCGSYGSRLHRTDNPDVYIAYAQWPNRELWAKNHVITGEKYLKAREQMRACLLNSQTRYSMTVCDDYLM
ncbi:MAG: antibiotic biosynthesis monooxygenase family protein [Vibrio sp.]